MVGRNDIRLAQRKTLCTSLRCTSPSDSAVVQKAVRTHRPSCFIHRHPPGRYPHGRHRPRRVHAPLVRALLHSHRARVDPRGQPEIGGLHRSGHPDERTRSGLARDRRVRASPRFSAVFDGSSRGTVASPDHVSSVRRSVRRFFDVSCRRVGLLFDVRRRLVRRTNRVSLPVVVYVVLLVRHELRPDHLPPDGEASCVVLMPFRRRAIDARLPSTPVDHASSSSTSIPASTRARFTFDSQSISRSSTTRWACGDPAPCMHSMRNGTEPAP